MTLPVTPVFLARRTYRRRRLVDAARILPVLGAVLFVLPVLLLTPGEEGRLSVRVVYFFSVWLGLVACAAGLALFLRRGGAEPGAEQGAEPPLQGPVDGDGPV